MSMFVPLLHPSIQDFIKQNLNADIRKLAFAKNPFPEINWQQLLNQIKSRQKALEKIPHWGAIDGIIYPPALSIEQCSSQATALFKSTLIKDGTVLDVTGGMGIDDYFLSLNNTSVIYCELQTEVFETAQHNFKLLNATNIITHQGDGIEKLKEQQEQLDHVYLDPARRDNQLHKVFLIEDCTPNVVEHLHLFQQKCKNLWIKTSPLLDLTATIQKLQQVTACYIIAVQNEVKELLWHVQWQPTQEPVKIITVDIHNEETRQWSATFPDLADADYSEPLQYLYVPNSAMFKSGLFNSIGQHYKLYKLQQHAHLYTSDEWIDFPGRSFVITEIIPYQKQNFKRLKGLVANISTRNFPEKVETLIKKHQLKNGGTTFAFFTTNVHQEKIVILAHKK